MSLASIRKQYGVPANRGQPIRYTGGGLPRIGTITGSSATGSYIRARMESGHICIFHPTWEIEYLPAAKDEETKGG